MVCFSNYHHFAFSSAVTLALPKKVLRKGWKDGMVETSITSSRPLISNFSNCLTLLLIYVQSVQQAL